jgi:hypothetical protein
MKIFFSATGVLLLLCSSCLLQAQDDQVFKAEIKNMKTHLQGLKKVSGVNADLIKKPVIKGEKYDFEITATDGEDDISEVVYKKDLEIKSDKSDLAINPELNTNTTYFFNATHMSGLDAMVAVGQNFVIASDAGQISMYKKSNGQNIFNTNADDFFSIFLSPTIGGNANPNYITFPDVPANIPWYCNRDDYNPNTTTGKGLIQDAYDVRIMYEKSHRRFVVLAALRNQVTRTCTPCVNPDQKKDCKDYAIRLVAWAVSASEDPSQGWYFYRTGKSNYRDWPRFTVDQDYLVIANNGPGDNNSALVQVYSFPDMVQAKSSVRKFTIKRQDAMSPVKSVIPIPNHPSNSLENYLYFAQKVDDSRGLSIWYIKKPGVRSAIFDNPPSFLSPAGTIKFETKKFKDPLSGIIYSDGKIWVVSNQVAYGASNNKNAGYGLNVFKIPVKQGNNGNKIVSMLPMDGFWHSFYSHPDYSYEKPAIAVNIFKDMAISFIRYPVAKNSNEKSEVRYKAFFHGEVEPRGSVLVKESERSETGKLKIDYSWLTHDPYETMHFWVAHSFLNANNQQNMVVKKIDLQSIK